MQNHQRSWLRHHIIKAHGHSPCCGVYQLRLDFSVRGGGGGGKGEGGGITYAARQEKQPEVE